jgi:hypothetical protein
MSNKFQPGCNCCEPCVRFVQATPEEVREHWELITNDTEERDEWEGILAPGRQAIMRRRVPIDRYEFYILVTKASDAGYVSANAVTDAWEFARVFNEDEQPTVIAIFTGASFLYELKSPILFTTNRRHGEWQRDVQRHDVPHRIQ